jgi:hypothetical protein
MAMNKFPGTIKVRVKHPELPDSISTSLMRGGSPEKTIATLNKRAAELRLEASYSLATEAEYWAYRAALKAAA